MNHAPQGGGEAQRRASALGFLAVTLPGQVCIPQHHRRCIKETWSKSNSAASVKQPAPGQHTSALRCFQDLSGAYTNLEAHCYQVEAEVRRLKEQLAQALGQASAQATAEQPGELLHLRSSQVSSGSCTLHSSQVTSRICSLHGSQVSSCSCAAAR